MAKVLIIILKMVHLILLIFPKNVRALLHLHDFFGHRSFRRKFSPSVHKHLLWFFHHRYATHFAYPVLPLWYLLLFLCSHLGQICRHPLSNPHR
uniref:Uncharacterized protein n=1 Tax=Panstrongylus lignarius TaxID=156445 RepID=A0A224Y319_9HEMI